MKPKLVEKHTRQQQRERLNEIVYEQRLSAQEVQKIYEWALGMDVLLKKQSVLKMLPKPWQVI